MALKVNNLNFNTMRETAAPEISRHSAAVKRDSLYIVYPDNL